MNTTNVQAWVDTLASTTEQQGDGALCEIRPTGPKRYCCLGLGSTLVPGMPGRVMTLTHMTHSPALQQMIPPQPPVERVAFGDSGSTLLAPVEFLRWLGLEPAAHHPGHHSGGFDIYFNLPHLPEGGDDSMDLCDLSAAALNDHGFTFTQIADIIRCFGIDEARTTRETREGGCTHA